MNCDIAILPWLGCWLLRFNVRIIHLVPPLDLNGIILRVTVGVAFHVSGHNFLEQVSDSQRLDIVRHLDRIYGDRNREIRHA